MGRLPGLDQLGRMALDCSTGSEQDEHPAGLFDDTGPTREDVKSSEEGGLLARLFGHQVLVGKVRANAVRGCLFFYLSWLSLFPRRL